MNPAFLAMICSTAPAADGLDLEAQLGRFRRHKDTRAPAFMEVEPSDCEDTSSEVELLDELRATHGAFEDQPIARLAEAWHGQHPRRLEVRVHDDAYYVVILHGLEEDCATERAYEPILDRTMPAGEYPSVVGLRPFFATWGVGGVDYRMDFHVPRDAPVHEALWHFPLSTPDRERHLTLTIRARADGSSGVLTQWLIDLNPGMSVPAGGEMTELQKLRWWRASHDHEVATLDERDLTEEQRAHKELVLEQELPKILAAEADYTARTGIELPYQPEIERPKTPDPVVLPQPPQP